MILNLISEKSSGVTIDVLIILLLYDYILVFLCLRVWPLNPMMNLFRQEAIKKAERERQQKYKKEREVIWRDAKQPLQPTVSLTLSKAHFFSRHTCSLVSAYVGLACPILILFTLPLSNNLPITWNESCINILGSRHGERQNSRQIQDWEKTSRGKRSALVTWVSEPPDFRRLRLLPFKNKTAPAPGEL